MTASSGNAGFQFTPAAGGGHGPAGSGSGSFQFTSAAKSTVTEAYASQVVELGVASGVGAARASFAAMLTLGTQPAEYIFDSQIAALSLTQITAKEMYDSEISLLTTGANPMTTVQSSQIAILTLSRANPSRRTMRAWRFWMDGHDFYVIHLGNLTTLVFDTLTRKWSEWHTELFNNWRANYGINWNEDIVAGGIDNNLLYLISPSASTDDGSPIISVITGGYPMRMRTSATCDEIMVTSSVGVSSAITATMGMRTSDDYGVTWDDWGTLDLSTATPKTQVTWQSLGEMNAPGRIFELTDSGAAKRINSLDLYSRDIPNG